MNCIWCLSPTSAAEPEEHIVPEGLVGGRPLPLRIYGANPSVRDVRLVLDRGEVCGGCNARNGKLDDAVQGYFGFLKPALNRVGTKSGKPATAARPGMYAERRKDGVHVIINATGDYALLDTYPKRG